ncbi:unnamed protein product [Phaedon cochleariae]|uniref:Amino acid transporter transmembrane domain-containing protein n=1 Tax=Phaedon cochleariae TaxID=80249 RepID=A0A9P0GUE2_PHACE|nr:unnamed protein product [Phaedon cochleariae]
MRSKKQSFTLSHDINYNSRSTLNNNEAIDLSSISGSCETMRENIYNPYEHRILQHPNTYFGAVVHIAKGSLGTGVLAVPRAFKTAGLLVGTIGTVLVGILCTYNVHLLVSASLKICVKTKTPSLGFSESVEEIFKNGPMPIRSWSKFAKIFVEIALCLTYYLAIAVYAVFISESLTKLVSFYHPPASSWNLYFILVLFVLLVVCCQIRELKRLVPFSVVANMAMVTAFLITLYYMCERMAKVNVAERHLATSLSAIPSYFSTVLFAMEGIGTILPVENSMSEGRFLGFGGALNLAMAFVVTCHTTIGFCGYYAFGEDTKAAITQNLPSDEIPAQVVQGCISASMFFTFMLNHHVPTEILWRRLQPYVPTGKEGVAQVALRSSTVTFAMLVAAAANKNLDALMDLVGAVFFSILGLFVPAVVDILVNWSAWGRYHWRLLQDGVLIVMALFALVSGTYYAL